MLEWDDLRFFLAIWRAGTMSGAARSLKVNQTTVGRRLGTLEERLGVLLFDRTPDGFRVTTAGQKIVPVASQMEEAAHSLERLVAGSDEKLAGSVRLACSETLAIGFILDGLSAFRQANPRIALEVMTGNPPINLLRREADVAIRTPKPTHSELLVRKLADVAWFVYVAGRAAVPGDASSLEGCEAVGYEGELADLRPAQWLNQRVPPERVALRCNSILSARAAIASGIGVGALPGFIGDPDPALRRAVAEPITAHEMWLAVHPQIAAQARVRGLVDFLVDLFARNHARFAGHGPP